VQRVHRWRKRARRVAMQEPRVTLTPAGYQQVAVAGGGAANPWETPGTWTAPTTSKVLPPPSSGYGYSAGSPPGLVAAAPARALQPCSPPATASSSAGSWPPRAPQQALVPVHAPRQDEPQPLAVAVAQQALADPKLREALKHQALVVGGHAADAARYCGRQGLMAFQDYVQQGPQGVSVLCFVGGLATTILGAMSICNFFGTVMDPFHYILNAYVFVFGLTTTTLEADTDRIGMMIPPFDRLAEPVTRAQAWLHEECRLLTRLRGRGFFYLYQGTLLVTQCVFCALFLCGLYSALMGAVCILMSFGITPDIERIAESAGLGVGAAPYRLVADSAEAEGGSPVSVVPDQLFRKAEGAWKKCKERLPGKACRELWALHKQATVGDCNEPKPGGVFNGSAKEQWRLWTGLRGVGEADAKALFIERLRREEVPV